jgi:hypothetical protein
MAALKVQARFEKSGDRRAAREVAYKPCCDEDDAFEALAAAPAVTAAGPLAKLVYFQELSADDETSWMVNDRAPASVLIDSFVASLRNVGVRS